MTEKWHLAQVNVATMRDAEDSPVMRPFFDRLDAVNAIADASPGFVWRLVLPDDIDLAETAFPEPMALVNMSVWEDAESLAAYAYRSGHADAMRRRGEWFLPHEERFQVLWWIPAGHKPSLSEARARLDQIRAQGPTPDAFDFVRSWPPPGSAPSNESVAPDPKD